MALGDSLLDAAIKTYQPVDSYAEDETSAQKIESNQSMLAQQQQQLEEGQLKLGAEAEETPLNTALVKQQGQTSLLYNAIAKATDAQSFDANLRAISDQVPQAQQYIGRYTPVLQSRLLGVFGTPQTPIGANSSTAGLDQPVGTPTKGSSASGADTSGMDYQFAQTTPEQRAASLKNLTALSQGLEQVGDENSWNAMRQKLDAAGIPLMDQLGDYSPIKAASLYQRVQPVVTYLQNRSVADQSGVPAPKAPADIKVVGSSLFAVDPNNPYAPATNIGSPGGAPSGDVSNLHGDDFLKTLAPGMAAEVKGLSNGSIPFPTGISVSRLQPLIAAASQYDPTLDATNYTSRAKTRNEFTPGGAVGKNIVALNRVVQHAANTLLPAFQALDNSSVPMWNGAVNSISEGFGGATPTNARQAVDAVSSEARKVFAASGSGNLTELENWQKNFPINGSPAQQLGALKTFGGLLQSQIDTMQDQWDKNMGANNKMPVRNLFSPEGRQAVDKLNSIDPNKGFEQFTQPAKGWSVTKVGGQ